MNLIEQLGGYEKAKEWYKDQDLRGNHTVRIRHALLEYRRANNIFEVGDKVVVLVNALGNKYTWIVKAIDGCMVQISQVGQPDEWVHFSEITHATDEITRGFK
ncbi:hypothetical protein [Acinetobacter radioresistens]|uniref:hypothetical protein n=1 Tax=Acinetobacter radioresistens TaxID=40216 RepID=UPI000619FC8E|nr:hypothetical protein [Acinetobacter radioresistens]